MNLYLPLRMIGLGCVTICLSACQQESNTNGEDTHSDHPVRIHGQLTSRASASDGSFGLSVPIQVLKGERTNEYTDIWEATAESNSLTLKPQRFYPLYNESLFLRGLSPAPTTVIDAGKKYAFDLSKGDPDIILSNEVTGSYYAPFSDTDQSTYMKFEHLLAQIQFQLFNNGAFPLFRKITKITLKGAHDTVNLDVITGALEYSGGTDVVVFDYEDFPELKEQGGYIAPLTEYGTVGTPKTFQPGVGLTVVFTYDNGDSSAEFAIDFSKLEAGNPGHGNLAKAGYSYKVRFLLTGTITEPNLTIEAWKEVTHGSLNTPTGDDVWW